MIITIVETFVFMKIKYRMTINLLWGVKETCGNFLLGVAS